MKKVTVLGAGKIGTSIAKLLHHSKQYDVVVLDNNKSALDRIQKDSCLATGILDVNNPSELDQALTGQWAVISACAFDFSAQIAKAALRCGINYFDLTEDVETTKYIRNLAQKAKPGQIFMPQCGLAPGFISILAHSLSHQFESIDTLKMRVGALPQYPTNKMKYNLTWSTDGLINEYCNPCEVLKNGELIEVLPLEGLETFSLDGKEYEAFNTSGGLGTLCETLQGKVQNLNYKTVRYQGHQYLADFLVNGLALGKTDRRQLLKQIMETAIPITRQDVILIFVSVTGQKHGQFTQISDARKIYDTRIFGEHWSSIQITTAASACVAMDLHAKGALPKTGFIKQEQIELSTFLENPFGAYYQK
ncbi:MAG: saccharopine dehydrogenase NADP-binding domain-containing protein [Pseudomonadales bacterium]|nr:saccharopine dehydrogenase NADP-binding domain-containing protein [Pseudomonadales bacterium]